MGAASVLKTDIKMPFATQTQSNSSKNMILLILDSDFCIGNYLFIYHQNDISKLFFHLTGQLWTRILKIRPK